MRWLNLVKIDDFVRAGLHQELARVIDRIQEIGAAIHRTFFDVRIESAESAERPAVDAPKTPTEVGTTAPRS